ncbi:1,4-dihydroxy-2-naphthoyl-CoA hydrolase [Algoriphagus iocasae]|jgi:1,4-dihydroxy-2-naphthoyl-CoA hydrolase|uniref:1,4-dihydroxy-2-naphthoyl-CoA hydrolase n=1 Tax=Algoriphagus iocasae TaxID=1836499 RepID=A0A841MLR0_9BACT|nr:hotdog fold thioesterase [Algoriphagus iocasae]MBB6325176.1 1,4-dihydroxy-2-naphthoyl-CoA hydrolase [Algoriphagus iocasae]
MVFKRKPSLEELNKQGKNTMVSHLGIIFTDISDNSISATMPVDERTKQPMGLLHGGANVVLAETLGSIASSLTIDLESQTCVGLEINANHIKAVRSGIVKGTTTPIHIGRKTQIWEIKIFNEQDQLSCISRITVAIIDKK